MSNTVYARGKSGNCDAFNREHCTESPRSCFICFPSTAKDFTTQLQENANRSLKERVFQAL